MNPATDWIDQARRVLESLRSSVDDAAAPDADGAHPSDCRWCPICQLAAVVRGERPEVTAALADVLTATATALRTFAAATEPQTAPPAEDDAPEEEPPPVAQQIEIA